MITSHALSRKTTRALAEVTQVGYRVFLSKYVAVVDRYFVNSLSEIDFSNDLKKIIILPVVNPYHVTFYKGQQCFVLEEAKLLIVVVVVAVFNNFQVFLPEKRIN